MAFLHLSLVGITYIMCLVVAPSVQYVYRMYYNIYPVYTYDGEVHHSITYEPYRYRRCVVVTKRRIIKWILQHFIVDVAEEDDNTAYTLNWLGERVQMCDAKYSFHYIFDIWKRKCVASRLYCSPRSYKPTIIIIFNMGKILT